MRASRDGSLRGQSEVLRVKRAQTLHFYCMFEPDNHYTHTLNVKFLIAQKNEVATGITFFSMEFQFSDSFPMIKINRVFQLITAIIQKNT